MGSTGSACQRGPNRVSLEASCLLHKMAPQVGLEPTTLRLTAGQCASCSLILKAFLAVQGRHNRCTWGVWLDKLLDNLSTSPIGPETQREWRICIGTNSAHRGKVGCTTPNFRSLWAPHLKYPCRWYERAGSRRSCSKYHQLVRAVRHPQSSTLLPSCVKANCGPDHAETGQICTPTETESEKPITLHSVPQATSSATAPRIDRPSQGRPQRA